MMRGSGVGDIFCERKLREKMGLFHMQISHAAQPGCAASSSALSDRLLSVQPK